MYPANQFPGRDRVRGPENLKIRLTQRALYEIKDQLTIIDSNKLNGRWNTCELTRFPPKPDSFMIYQITRKRVPRKK